MPSWPQFLKAQAGGIAVDPAQSKTLRMRGNLLHGNREVPQARAADGATGRPEKVIDHTSGTHACGKSDGRVVPEKPSNKGMRPAEVVERRRPAEGNFLKSISVPTARSDYPSAETTTGSGL